MKRINGWFIMAFFMLLGCQSPTATSRPEPTLAVLATADAEMLPAETAVPKPTNTPVPTPAVPTPSPVPQVSPTSREEASQAPSLVWLPYATGNYNETVLMLGGDDPSFQPMPVEVEIFFDYEAGWLAYGSRFWGATTEQQSVTDLQIYNFVTGTNEQWAAGIIGRAALSPVSQVSDQPVVAAAVHNGQGFDLVLFSVPDGASPLIEDIDPYFSWSPDGNQIAYLRNGELFVTSSARDSGLPPIASNVYQNGGWIGDAPLWLGNSGYLLYADDPFTIVAVDGSETVVSLGKDGTVLQEPRPFAMLYSPTANQLIAESEGMFGSSVIVYQLGEGFETVVALQRVDDAQLAGWYEENESVVILSGGEPEILPLTPPD